MTAHLSDSQIRAYRQRSLQPAELLSVSEHIGACEGCRARVASNDELSDAILHVKSSLRLGKEPGHLSYEQLEAYVDETLPPAGRAALESHAQTCPACATDLDEIRSLRRELHSAAAGATRRTKFRNRLLRWRAGLVLAGVAACLVLAIVLLRAPSPPHATMQNHPVPAPPGSVIRDGTLVLSVNPAGRLAGLDGLPEPDRAVLERALEVQAIEPAATLADISGNRSLLLGASGGSAGARLLEPLSTVVESQSPVFRWDPASSATFRVTVDDSSFNVVVQSGWISAAEWQASKPLARGGRYSWQLTVHQNGSEFTVPAPPAPEARFRILAGADETEIVRARTASDNSHLALGVLYAHYGLLDQAGQELLALRAQNPQSVLVTSLLASVQRLRAGPQ